MMQSCAIDFERDCDQHLPLMEFSYNNGYQTTIGMTPYEAFYGQRCMMSLLVRWIRQCRVGPRGHRGDDYKDPTIQACLETANDRTTAYVNK